MGTRMAAPLVLVLLGLGRGAQAAPSVYGAPAASPSTGSRPGRSQAAGRSTARAARSPSPRASWSLSSQIVVPAAGTPAISSLSVTKLSNLSGGPACNGGGLLGGTMARAGTIFVNIIPGVVVIPMNLLLIAAEVVGLAALRRRR